MADTVKVIVDYHYTKKKSKVDTGDWQLICRKKAVESNSANACGLNFVCEGTKIKVKKQKGPHSASNIAVHELTLESQKADEAIKAEDIEEVLEEDEDEAEYPNEEPLEETEDNQQDGDLQEDDNYDDDEVDEDQEDDAE